MRSCADPAYLETMAQKGERHNALWKRLDEEVLATRNALQRVRDRVSSDADTVGAERLAKQSCARHVRFDVEAVSMLCLHSRRLCRSACRWLRWFRTETC
jgi:hypothetical protein